MLIADDVEEALKKDDVVEALEDEYVIEALEDEYVIEEALEEGGNLLRDDAPVIFSWQTSQM